MAGICIEILDTGSTGGCGETDGVEVFDTEVDVHEDEVADDSFCSSNGHEGSIEVVSTVLCNGGEGELALASWGRGVVEVSGD